MTGTPKLRAGLIGLGAMGRNHARVLQIVDGVELVGVAEPNGDGNNGVRGSSRASSVTSTRW
jgi:UDP-N-acetylglucosamine 3-dehydrogenase